MKLETHLRLGKTFFVMIRKNVFNFVLLRAIITF
jgi:hypothetical protein